MTKIAVLALLLLFAAASFTLAGPEYVTLGNGTRVVLSEGPSTSLAAVCIMIEGGTSCEGPAERGTYSLLPDLILCGTASRTKAQITRELSILGDSFDSHTSPRYWAFEATVPAASLEHLLLLLRDVLFFPSLTEKEFEKKKSTRTQSIRAEKDSPQQLLSDLYYSVFYPDLYAPGETRITNIENARLPLLQGVHGRYFRPGGTVVSIAGALNMEEALGITEKVFGGLRQGPEPLPEAGAGQREGPLPFYRAAGGGVTQAGILTGTRLSGFDRSDEHLLQLVGAVLDKPFGGRLFTELREKNGLVYSVSTGYSLQTEPFSWYAVSTSRKRNIKAVVEKTEDVLRLLKKKPPDAQELLLAKEHLKTRLSTDALFPVREARYNAGQVLLGETPRGINERLRMIDAVTQEELAFFIKNYFPDRWTSLVVR
jgi:zinc protease